MALVAQRINFVDTGDQLLCMLMAFLKGILIGTVLLITLLIIVRRYRRLGTMMGNLLVYRLVLLTWVTAVVTVIPAAFTIACSSNPNNNNETTNSGDEGSALYGQCWKNSSNGSELGRSKLQLVRFIVLHLMIFSFTWLPFAVILFM